MNPHFRQKHAATVVLRARRHQKTPGKRQENIRKTSENIRKHQKTSVKHQKKTPGEFSFSRLRKVFEKEDKALPSGATHFPDPDGLRSAHGRAAGRARVKRNAMLMHITASTPTESGGRRFALTAAFRLQFTLPSLLWAMWCLVFLV